MTEVGYAKGKCSRCSRTYTRKRPAFSVYCDCWKICPLCSQEMTPYKPDLTPSVYDPEKGLRVVMVCLNHSPPHYSKDLPVEVKLK